MPVASPSSSNSAARSLPPRGTPATLTADHSKAEIRHIEQMLARAGFNPGPKDGVANLKTIAAIKAFQEATGLPQSGVVDDRMMNRLGAVVKRVKEHGGKRLGVGQQGERIQKFEHMLKRLGYDVKADGVFDRETAAAVRHFKRDQPALRRRAQSELLGPAAQRTLQREVEALKHKPRKKVVDASRRRRAEDRLVAMGANKKRDGVRGVREGDRGPAVQVIQRHLRVAGFNPKRTDGVFDERTAGMVKELQRKAGLKDTGRVNPATWKELQGVTVERSGRQEQARIMKRARNIGGTINRTGGYRFDGVNDCWGFVRRVWDPVLSKQGKSKLPVGDAGTASGRKNWNRITNWNKVPVGTPLSTHEGHAWGSQWHGGLFAGVKKGVPYIYDCSGSRDGCYLRPMPPGLFKYFYAPAAKELR